LGIEIQVFSERKSWAKFNHKKISY
jgi:hypothetical protein